MGDFTFSWDSSGDISILDRCSLQIENEGFSFAARFHVAAASAFTDATMATAVTAAYAYRAINKAFTYKKGSETLFSVDPSTNTGFLTKCTIMKDGHPGDMAMSQMLLVKIQGQLPASYDSRSGRREASVTVSQDPSELRSLTFTGTWTALPGGSPTSALASYSAAIDSWISTWLSVFTAASGAYWQKFTTPTISVDDQNKLLAFTVSYHEVKFTYNPGEDDLNDPDGLIQHGSFSIIPATMIGTTPNISGSWPGDATMILAASPNIPEGRASGFSGAGSGGGSHTTVVPGRHIPLGGGGSPENQFAKRYHFRVTLSPKISAVTPGNYWIDTIKPWVINTITEMFGAETFILDSIDLEIIDTPIKAVNVSGSFTESGGKYYEYEEEFVYSSDPRFQWNHVYDGVAHSYDVTGGLTEDYVQQVITVSSVGQAPSEPLYLSGRFQLTGPSRQGRLEKRVGNVTNSLFLPGDVSTIFTRSFYRTYIRVEKLGAKIDLKTITPFGGPGKKR